jgi:hypothetical protein
VSNRDGLLVVRVIEPFNFTGIEKLVVGAYSAVVMLKIVKDALCIEGIGRERSTLNVIVLLEGPGILHHILTFRRHN